MLNLDLWKLLLDLKSIASDILRYIFEPAEWIRYIAIYFNLPSEYDTWPADKPPIYLQKSFTTSQYHHELMKYCPPSYVLCVSSHFWPFIIVKVVLEKLDKNLGSADPPPLSWAKFPNFSKNSI